MSSIALKNISHYFDQQPVLDNVSVDVKGGEILCLVGPSGCGKSTLLRIISGLEETQQGDVLFNDENLNHLAAEERGIGLVFQHPSLFPHLTVAQNVAFGIQHWEAHERKQRVAELIEQVGLTGKSDDYPHMLSGGQHQRVALARALAPKPRAMLLDEPFANLDHALRYELREDVMNILKQADVPVMMVTHNPDEALIMADKMLLLRQNGQVHQVGKPEDVHDRPVDISAANFFGPINTATGKVDGGYVVSEFGKIKSSVFAQPLKDGEDVTVVARPEGMGLCKKGGVHVKVQKVAHTGIGHLITGNTPNGQRVLFNQYPETELSSGDEVRLCCVPPHVFVFKN